MTKTIFGALGVLSLFAAAPFTMADTAGKSGGFYVGGGLGLGVSTLKSKDDTKPVAGQKKAELPKYASSISPAFHIEGGYRFAFSDMWFADLGAYIGLDTGSVKSQTAQTLDVTAHAGLAPGVKATGVFNGPAKIKSQFFGGLKAKFGGYVSDNAAAYFLAGLEFARISSEFDVDVTVTIAGPGAAPLVVAAPNFKDKLSKMRFMPYVGLGMEFGLPNCSNFKLFMEGHYVFNTSLNLKEKAGKDGFETAFKKKFAEDSKNTKIGKFRVLAGVRYFF